MRRAPPRPLVSYTRAPRQQAACKPQGGRPTQHPAARGSILVQPAQPACSTHLCALNCFMISRKLQGRWAGAKGRRGEAAAGVAATASGRPASGAAWRRGGAVPGPPLLYIPPQPRCWRAWAAPGIAPVVHLPVVGEARLDLAQVGQRVIGGQPLAALLLTPAAPQGPGGGRSGGVGGAGGRQPAAQVVGLFGRGTAPVAQAPWPSCRPFGRLLAPLQGSPGPGGRPSRANQHGGLRTRPPSSPGAGPPRPRAPSSSWSGPCGWGAPWVLRGGWAAAGVPAALQLRNGMGCRVGAGGGAELAGRALCAQQSWLELHGGACCAGHSCTARARTG